jgi:N-acetylglutamate synthase-like GNAT family acetyltransferase
MSKESTNQGYRLRPATAADSARIKDLIRRVFINRSGLDWRRFIVAETDTGEFIGCAQLKPHHDSSVELASLAVEQAYRGEGVARKLIEHLLEAGPRPLYLMCRPALVPLYEKFGFYVIENEPVSPFFQRIRFLLRTGRLFTGRQLGFILRLD